MPTPLVARSRGANPQIVFDRENKNANPEYRSLPLDEDISKVLIRDGRAILARAGFIFAILNDFFGCLSAYFPSSKVRPSTPLSISKIPIRKSELPNVSHKKVIFA
jgi:hypothetical protein